MAIPSMACQGRRHRVSEGSEAALIMIHAGLGATVNLCGFCSRRRLDMPPSLEPGQSPWPRNTRAHKSGDLNPPGRTLMCPHGHFAPLNSGLYVPTCRTQPSKCGKCSPRTQIAFPDSVNVTLMFNTDAHSVFTESRQCCLCWTPAKGCLKLVLRHR